MADLESHEDLLLKIKELEDEVKKLNLTIRKDSDMKYGLRWIDVPEAFEKESENKIPILEEVKSKSIKTDDDKPTHILIEGDNYHALKCLNYTHKGKIDFIYIDPPYNTGSNFSYRDKLDMERFPDGTPVNKNHPLRHSYWLSFMEKRLKLAYNILKDNGCIFVSINEDEIAQLKLLLDKIFKPENYITIFTIKVRHEDRILKGDKPIHETTEFLLLYQKSLKFRIQKRLRDNSSPDEYIYQIKELVDNPDEMTCGRKIVKIFKPGEYEIRKVPASFDNLKKINIRGTIKTGNSSGRFHMSYLEPLRDEFNVLYKVPDMGDDGLGYRYFLSRKNERSANGFYFQGEPIERQDVVEIPYPNYFDFEDIFNNVGTEGGVPFDGGKKPVEFIKTILKIATKRDDFVILDFFGGSGSTCHSIIDLNLDNGCRQCITVQSPDKTYEIKNGNKVPLKGSEKVFHAGFERIVDITYQRIKNTIQGYSSGTEEKIGGLGNSLKYYKTSFIGNNEAVNANDTDKIDLAHKAGCLLALGENTLEELERTDCYQIFTGNNGKYTGVYFTGDAGGLGEFCNELEKIRNRSRVNRINAYFYCSGNGDEFENEFDSLKNIKIKTIPEPILKVYRVLNV